MNTSSSLVTFPRETVPYFIKGSPMSINDNDWFERIWEHREEVIYPSLFGSVSEGIFSIPPEKTSDPRWSTCGVFRYAPTVERQSWLYVSSGLSNAWFDDAPDPNSRSGFGCEFLMETQECADWPIIRLHQIMKYQIDLCCGKYPDAGPLGVFDRIPLGSPLDFAASSLTYVMLTEPKGFSSCLQQESGLADFHLLSGITETEKQFAKENSGGALLELLLQKTEFPITNPSRQTIEL